MSNSIMQQAAALVNNGEDRMNQRASINEVERLQQEANNAQALAQARQQKHQAVAQYHSSGAEQEKIQGQNLLQQGAAKKAVGGAMMAMGGVMVLVGAAMMILGGAGAGLIGKGMGMIGQGIGQLVMGGVDQAQGRQALARFQEKLDLATSHDIISKEENRIVKKEMTRSQVFEMKKQMLEDIMEVLRPMLDQMGLDGEDMTEDQLTKWFDKMIEKGAEMLVNGGILETDLQGLDGKPMFADEDGQAMTGMHYFMRDEESGSIFKIEVARDAEGNVLTGALGEPLLNMDSGAIEVEDGALKQYLKNQFQMMDYARTMAMQVGLNPDDYNEATEFADLVHKTNLTAIKEGRIPGPLKVIIEGGKVYLQEWDYRLDVPIGPKTPADELAGGDYDRGDIESYQLAMERSDAAMQTLGFAGGARFNLLMSTQKFGFAASRSNEGGFGSMSGRDSEAFANFTSIRNTIDISRSGRDILSSSDADETSNRRFA
jgi:hypothetical protein